MKMLSVPKVTMNGGRLSRVTSSAVDGTRQAAPTAMPISSAKTPGTPFLAARLAMTNDGQDGDRANRQVDAGGQDDQRLPDRESRDHRHLLQDDADGVGRDETRVDDREDDEGHDQHQQRADRGMGMQQLLDSLQWRLLPQRELLCRGMWCLRFDCCCHVASLRKRHPVFARGNVLPPPTVGWLRH